MRRFSYSKFEGIGTPWLWLDRLLCKLLGHPDRSYMTCTPIECHDICARCLEDKEQ